MISQYLHTTLFIALLLSPPTYRHTALNRVECQRQWMNEWKCSDLKCIRKATRSRLSLTHWPMQPLSRLKSLDSPRVRVFNPVGKEKKECQRKTSNALLASVRRDKASLNSAVSVAVDSRIMQIGQQRIPHRRARYLQYRYSINTCMRCICTRRSWECIGLCYLAIFSNPAVQLFSCKYVTIKLSWVELRIILEMQLPWISET